MPQYMLQFTYTAQAWAALSAKPVDRTSTVQALAKKLGCKLHSLYYTMGDFDGFAIVEAPDDVTAIAFVIAAATPGHLKSTKTTRLFTAVEAFDAMKKSQGANYQAPK